MGSHSGPDARRRSGSKGRPGRAASQEVDSARRCSLCNWSSLNTGPSSVCFHAHGSRTRRGGDLPMHCTWSGSAEARGAEVARRRGAPFGASWREARASAPLVKPFPGGTALRARPCCARPARLRMCTLPIRVARLRMCTLPILQSLI